MVAETKNSIMGSWVAVRLAGSLLSMLPIPTALGQTKEGAVAANPGGATQAAVQHKTPADAAPAGVGAVAMQAGDHIPAQIGTPRNYRPAITRVESAVRWSYTLSHPGATYLAIHFVDFNLGPDDYLAVYDSQGILQYIMTGRGKMGAGTFWAQHVKDDTVELELVVGGKQGGAGFKIDEYVAGFVELEVVGIEEAICGLDDKENAVCYMSSHPVEYDRGRAVARLLIDGSWLCTGWLVSPDNKLLTNEHCITTASDALNTDFDFMAEAPLCGSSNCQLCYSGSVFSGATLIRNNSNLDYALVQINSGNPAGTFGYLEIDDREPVVGEEIYVPQHPSGRAKEFSIYSTHPNDPGGIPVIQSITADPCFASGYNDVAYFADTEGGSSGSPVLARSSHKVIALHKCGGCPNQAVPIHLVCDEIGCLPPDPADDYFTELFSSNDNDLDNRSLLLTPDGSTGFYTACLGSIDALPTDPAGGTPIALGDDSYRSITPSTSLSLYGMNYASFFVGSNGYVTLSAGDTAYGESLANHFDLPRISALFDDLNPSADGSVSWKELSDRVAVTWQNVPEYNTSNSNTFQIEMFFDGRIRISWLGIASADGLAGISSGSGTPSNFAESDLSDYGVCADPATDDYFTELFSDSDNDLENRSLLLTPDGSTGFYTACAGSIEALPTDPTGGAPIALGDDSSASITPSTSLSLYGVNYASFFVGSNGYVTFSAGDTAFSESLANHFDLPRISALFDDLNPSSGGTVSWKELADRVAVTWENVPEYSSANSNTFQVEMFFSGRIRISWLGIASADGLAGISSGSGIPGNFAESDLSGYGVCADLDYDGDVDSDDFLTFSNCFNGALNPPKPVCENPDADLDWDGDVDGTDFLTFSNCFNGALNPPKCQ